MRTRLAVFAAIVVAAVLGFGSSAPMGAEAAGPGTWTAAPDSTLALESGQSGVLLPSGRVLFLGFNLSVSTKIGMRYNPATNSWDTTDVTTFEHRWASLTQLRDGRVLTAGGVSLPDVEATASAETYSPFTNGWTLRGSMIEARYYHTATLLTDGRVLVAGGCGAGSTLEPFGKCPTGSFTPRLASAELFDPVTNSWSAAAPMTAARVFHTSTLLPDGRVLVTGGMSDPPTSLASAEIYDPLADTWTPIPNMSVARRSHSATLLPGGRVLVAGGEDATSTAEIYDPALNTWAGAGTLPLTYVRGSATLLGNGKVLVADYGQSTAIYAADTNTWSVSGDLPFGGNNGGAITLLHDGRALIAGGSSVLVQGRKTALYDATAWRTVAPMSVARAGQAGSVLFDGRVLISGNGSAEIYNPVTDAWSSTLPMSADRRYHDTATLPSGKVIAISGFTPIFDAISSTEIYDPATNAWTPGPPLPIPGGFTRALKISPMRTLVHISSFSSSASAVYESGSNTWSSTNVGLPLQLTAQLNLVTGSRALVTGGYATLPDQTPLASARLYNIAAATWSDATNMTHPRSAHAASTTINGRVVVSGGEPDEMSAEVYDPVTNMWSPLPSMSVGRLAHSSTLLDSGALLIAGGQDPSTGILASAESLSTSGIWSSSGAMNFPRREHTGLLLPSGNVLVAGGWDANPVPQHYLTSAEIFDIAIGTDTDGDGYNDGLELALGQHPWLNCKTMRADVSGDGLVNVADLGRVASKVGVRPPPRRIDQNGDKVVNVADLGLVASKSGQSVLSCA